MKLIELKKRFNSIVVVTLQDTVEDITISFIKKVAVMDKNFLYIIVPRYFSKKYKSLNIFDNIIVDEKLKFYDVILHVDFHSTVYSTCAIESVYFGVPNILLDFNDKSSNFFNDILKIGKFNNYVKNKSQFLRVINKSEKISKESVIKAHQDICTSNYRYNIENIKKLV